MAKLITKEKPVKQPNTPHIKPVVEPSEPIKKDIFEPHKPKKVIAMEGGYIDNKVLAKCMSIDYQIKKQKLGKGIDPLEGRGAYQVIYGCKKLINWKSRGKTKKLLKLLNNVKKKK